MAKQTNKSARFGLKTRIKKGFGTVTLAEYLDRAEKKKKPVSEVAFHLTKRGQTAFCNQCEQRGIPRPTPEFSPFEDIGRKHRIDFLFEHNGLRLALEIEGWGHRTLPRYNSDQFKYNELAIRKIHLLRVRPKALYQETTFDLLKRFFGV